MFKEQVPDAYKMKGKLAGADSLFGMRRGLS